MSESIASTRYSSTVSLPSLRQVETVGTVEAIVAKPPDDPLLGDRLLEYAVNAEMPLLGAARRQRSRRAHERLRCKRPDLIAGGAHLLEQMVDPPFGAVKRTRPEFVKLDGHGRSFAYRSATTPTPPDRRISSGALSLLRSIRTATMAVTAYATTLAGAPRAIVQTLDQTKPTIAGANPWEMIARHGEASKRIQSASKATMMTLDGTNIASVASGGTEQRPARRGRVADRAPRRSSSAPARACRSCRTA